VRQIKGKDVRFLLDTADHDKRFTKVRLSVSRRM
jgi:hypothetical protein